MGRSALRAALAAEKGIDFQKLKQKKQQKASLKAKKKLAEVAQGGAPSEEEDEDEGIEDDDEAWEDEEESGDESDNEDNDEANMLIDDMAEESEEDSDGEVMGGATIGNMDDSETSDSEVEFEEKIERPKPRQFTTPKPPLVEQKISGASEQGESDMEDEEEDVAWSDLDELEDMVPRQRLTINNHSALLASLKRIHMPTDSSVPFKTHQCITSSNTTADAIPDINDDLTRELQFYAQSLEAAKKGRALLLKEKVPFSRPTDYFAEMVKDDGHMEKVKAKLVADASAKKASAEARKQRDLKKFGKQVQVAKLQERQKAKKETLEKIKTLKRKRQQSSSDLPTKEGDLFDVAIDKEIKTSKRKAPDGRDGRGEDRPNAKRQRKNEKYGFGGKKRHNKSGDALSSGDLSGFSVKGMKARGPPRGTKGGGKGSKAPRPGKSRRKAASGRR